MTRKNKPPAPRTWEDWENARQLNRDDEQELASDDEFKRTDRNARRPNNR